METSLTHWKKLHNPNYLGAYSLDVGKDMILTIQTVKKELVESAKSEECTVIYFLENVKPMVLNATNSKQITKIYGTPYIEEWEGKKIQLYAAKIQAFGDEVEALRIRPKVPVLKKKPFTPKHPKWSAAKKALDSRNTTLADILKNYDVSEANQALLLKTEQSAA